MTPTEELLRLTRENNAMLTEIRDYIRKLQTSKYQDTEDMKQFCINVSANALWERLEERQKQEIGKNFDKNNQ